MTGAQAADLPEIRALLAASGLPGQDLTPAHLDVIPRTAAPLEIRATREFAELCPASSVCMTKRVRV
jgi:hypothetical protein